METEDKLDEEIAKMFDEVKEVRIETVDGKPRVTEETVEGDAKEMEEAIAALVQAERRFRKLDADPACVTVRDLNAGWWDALEALYSADKALWKLFVGSVRSVRSNEQYNEFRSRLIAGKRPRANA